MPSTDLYSEFGRFFSQDETVQVLSALRQDPLVWHNLEDEKFLEQALEKAGSQVSCWSPGRLGLLALEENRLPEELRAEPMPAPSQSLHEKALLAYQNVQRTGTPPATLREAALLAVALRERRRLTGTWSGLLQEILPKPAQAEALFAVWRTPLACLYSLAPDPEEMLRSLLPKNAMRVPLEWIVLTCLAQPASLEESAQVFLKLLQNLPVVYQLSILRILNLHGREKLVALCADRLLMGHPAFVNLRSQMSANNNDADLAGLGARALALQQMSTFYQLAGDRGQAFSLLNTAETMLKQWLAGLYLQRLDSQIGVKSGETLVLMNSDQLSHLASASSWLKDDLGAVLISHPLSNTVIDQVPGEREGTFFQLKRAALLFEREPGLARDLARQGAAGLLEEVRKQGIPFRGEFVYAWRPQDALQILLELDLPEEALHLAEAFLSIRPIDIALLHLTSKIYERLGKLENAIQVTCDLAALDPGSPAWQRLLGSQYGQASDWDNSFASWKNVLGLVQQPLVADRLACAHAAFRANLSEEAVALCEDILQIEPNNGAALGLLGRALILQGDLYPAVGHLVRATLLVPEMLEPWLALANAQQQLGEPFRALETLRAAVTAVPDAPEGHLALGQACLSAGLPAEALPYLKKAFLLSPEAEQTALLYGRTLRILGHATEARAVLERARSNWTTCSELAYEYAQVLLDLGDVESALPVFEMALRNGLPILDGYLLYAKVLLGEYNDGDSHDRTVSLGHLKQAESAIQRILEMEPDNLEAQFLMADLMRERGDLDDALNMYSLLAEQPISSDLHWRIQWGLGRTALYLGQSDIALAALKEACQSKPNNLQLQRTLAEASLCADLPQEALEAASDALQLAPDEIQNLAWYADFVASIGETRKSVEALQRAVQIDPDRADLWVNLANALLSHGDLSAARASLDRVVEMDLVSWKDLRKVGQAYLRLEDQPAALECFERAINLESPCPNDLLFEAAQLHARLGNLEEALDLTHQALTDMSDSLPVYLLQAELLSQLSRPQAALALLERALRIAQGESQDESNLPEERRSIIVDIHDRFTRLMLQENNLPAALHHAEKALALRPNQARLGYQAADLAMALLQQDRASRTVRSFQPAVGSVVRNFLDQGREGLDLLCLKVEIGLDEKNLENELSDGLVSRVDEALSSAPGEARLMVAKARLLSKTGKVEAAKQLFEGALQLLRKNKTADLSSAGLWLAEAYLDLEYWREALDRFEQYTASHPAEARAHLGLARAIVLCAERQYLCDALNCRKHAPGSSALNDENRQKFEEAVAYAGRLVNASEIARWQARGQAVFAPSPQTARSLAAVLAIPDDTAALVALMRKLNDRSAAVQIARRFPEDPGVLLQLALCYLEHEPAEGVAIAQKVAAARPDHPLAHVLLAILARRSGELLASQDRYETALGIWTDEPDWHDAAGDLYFETQQNLPSLSHHKRALELDPKNAVFAYKVGRSCLSNEDVTEAIAYLELSSALDPGSAAVWLELAAAYHIAGRLSEALEAAKRASELNPASAEGLMIAGETALSMNQVQQAMEYAQGAVRREPDNPAAVLFLSNVLILKDAPDEALATLEAASPAVKAIFSVAFERAKLIRRLHGPQAALEVLERLGKDYPEEPGLLGFLARTQAECGEFKSAEKYAFKALRLDPNQPELTLMLGRIQRKTGQLDQAVYLLAEAIRMSPDNLDAYLELGSVYQDRHETTLAVEVYRQALRVYPDDYQAYYQCGLILRDSKDYSGAEEMLRRAAELAPNNLSIRRQLVGVIALNLVHTKKEVSL